MAARGRQTFSRAERICRASDFERLKSEGQLLRGKRLHLRCLARESGGTRRFGVIVSRRHGGAVVRNRIRRRLRDIFRREKSRFPAGCDLLAIPLARAGGSSYRALREELLALAEKLKSKQGNPA